MGYNKIKIKGNVIFIIAMLFVTYEYLLGIVPSLIVEPLMRRFHATALQIGLLGSFYFYTLCLGQLIVGPIVDRFRVRFVLTLACLLCVVSILTATFATSLLEAQLSRLVMGLGSAFAYPIMLLMIHQWIERGKFPIYSGIGASFADSFLVVVNFIFAGVVVSAAWYELGYTLAGLGAFFAILAFIFVSERKTSAQVSETTASFFISIKKLFSNKRYWLLLVVTILYYVLGSVMFAMWGVTFLKQGQHLSHAQCSVVNACGFLGLAVGEILFGILAAYVTRYKLFIMGGAAASAVLISIIVYLQLSYLSLVILYFLMGFSVGPTINLFYVARDISENSVMATSMAVLNMACMLGAVIFQPIVGHILDVYWLGAMDDGARVFSAHAYGMAFLLVPFCQILAAVLAVFL